VVGVLIVYSIYCWNKGESSPVGDVDSYVVIRKLFDSVFYIIPVFIQDGEIRHTFTGILFRMVGYTRHDTPWFIT
jgi:hypothetical protein